MATCDGASLTTIEIAVGIHENQNIPAACSNLLTTAASMLGWCILMPTAKQQLVLARQGSTIIVHWQSEIIQAYTWLERKVFKQRCSKKLAPTAL